ncbi:MAG TPA: PAS domain S-box protein [Chitinophagaceae bacterium]|jgi:PAS domain S-box-containing protein|nr:PAS domain S-box protein [Chitinophagaceae bacterium]
MKPPFSRLSIRQRLPLLICLLLVIIILIYGFTSYIGVKKAALKTGYDRLKTLTEQLSTMLSGNTRTFISTTHTAANKPAIKKYILSNGKDSADEVSKLLNELRKDTVNVQVELRNLDKIQIFNSAKEGVNINVSLDSLLFIKSYAKLDSGRVGKLYAIGNLIYYPTMATITEQNKLIGYLIRWRRMTATPKALEQLSQLIGTGAKLYIGNADGKLWTDMMKPVSAPPVYKQHKSGITEYARSKDSPVIASMHPIANSKWLVVVELSKKKITEHASRFLYWLIIVGVILLIVGIFIAWLMSRNISDPLRNLTTAASAIAAGNYSSLVQVNRSDELGKLALAFNTMTSQVKKSQDALEKKAQKYKLLFEKNPMPMWIISKSTLDVIDVNEAAISHYGYSREEFLKLNAKELRPEEDIEKYLEHTSKAIQGTTRSGTWRHKKKDGTIIMVDVIADDIIFKDNPARLILANDVTEKLKAEAELSRQFFLRQKLITETTMQAQEKEREEIGKELHDNINQLLAASKLYLEIVLTGKQESLMEAAKKSYENVNLAINEIRQLSKQLVPPILEETLTSAIKDLAGEIQSASGILIKIEIEKFEEALINENLKLIIYRIVQEQVNNIVKHSRAKNVTIKIETKFDEVALTIADDGVGFDTNKRSRGIGLRNIASRVGFYSGTMNIESQPGKGCTLEASIPLKQEDNISASSA